MRVSALVRHTGLLDAAQRRKGHFPRGAVVTAARCAAGSSIANRCWTPRPPAGTRATSTWRVPAECVPVRQRMECVSCRGELSWCPPDCRHALARLDFGKRRNRRQDLLLENRTKPVFQHRAEQGQYGHTLLEHLFARSLAGFDETAILACCPERPGHCGAPAAAACRKHGVGGWLEPDPGPSRRSAPRILQQKRQAKRRRFRLVHPENWKSASD